MARHPHQIAERRSRALHRRVAERLLVDADLVTSARQCVARWQRDASVSPDYIEAWGRILDLPLAELVELLQEESETLSDLRQVSPFLGILSPQERWELLRHEKATREEQ